MTIHGTPLHAIHFTTPIPSAQVKTAVLFAGLQAEGTTSLSEAILTRDHTEHALKAFGATFTRTAAAGRPAKLSIPGGQKLHAIDATIPGDISSAAFFLCAALLFPDANLVLDSLGMNPTRAALLDIIGALGGRIKVLTVEEHYGELIGTIQVNRGLTPSTAPFVIGGALTAQVIDELPVLAAIAPYTGCGLIIRDAQELRVKESDRIALVAQNLRAMGANFTERPDGLEIPGDQSLHGAQIDSGSDHRIAMAFAIAALRAEGDTESWAPKPPPSLSPSSSPRSTRSPTANLCRANPTCRLPPDRHHRDRAVRRRGTQRARTRALALPRAICPSTSSPTPTAATLPLRHASASRRRTESAGTRNRIRALGLAKFKRNRSPQPLLSGYQPALHATLAGMRGFHDLMHDTPSLFDDPRPAR